VETRIQEIAMPQALAPASPPKNQPVAARSGRLGLRTAPGQEELLRLAARVSNKTLTEFILDSACKVAEQTLLDQRYFFADDAQWQAFNELLDRPPQHKPALDAMMQHKAPWES
jgi:uncharacterized protein (DUF1778 family)